MGITARGGSSPLRRNTLHSALPVSGKRLFGGKAQSRCLPAAHNRRLPDYLSSSPWKSRHGNQRNRLRDLVAFLVFHGFEPDMHVVPVVARSHHAPRDDIFVLTGGKCELDHIADTELHTGIGNVCAAAAEIIRPEARAGVLCF